MKRERERERERDSSNPRQSFMTCPNLKDEQTEKYAYRLINHNQRLCITKTFRTFYKISNYLRTQYVCFAYDMY